MGNPAGSWMMKARSNAGINKCRFTETNSVDYFYRFGFGNECKDRWDVEEGDYQNSGKSLG